MAMKNFTVIFLFLLAGQARADEWTSKDTALEATYLFLHIVDWGNTLYIADNPEKYYEYNSVIGTHPSRSRVNTYMAVSALAHVWVATLLPEKSDTWWIPSRRTFQHVTVGIKIGLVAHAYEVGIGFSF